MIPFSRFLLALCLGVSAIASAAPAQDCDNDTLLNHPQLLVVVPHPDDEVLGFSGLMQAYAELHRPVHVVVVTDGDAACGACQFWRNGGESGPVCSMDDLLAFGHTRRAETQTATSLLGHPSVTFLGYPDEGIGAALAQLEAGEPDAPIDRVSCDPAVATMATAFTGTGLVRTLRELVANVPSGTLIATAEPQAAHPDHAALGRLMTLANAGLGEPRPLVFGMVHPSTRGGNTECSYPPPSATDCACAEKAEGYFAAHPGLLDAEAQARYRPNSPASVPAQMAGMPLRLCLAPTLFTGSEPLKLRAIEAFGTQLGTSSRAGTPIPPSVRGLTDCQGFLRAYVHRTELFWPASGGALSHATPTSAPGGAKL